MSGPSLTRNAKFKLLIPVVYFVVAVAYLAFAWPQLASWNHYVGAALTVIAFVFWITARVQLGNAFTIAPEAKFLVKTGLYSKLRHPVYYFSILALAGLAVFIWSIYAAIIVSVLVILEAVRINKEEKILEQTFGEEYQTYKASSWF